MPDDFGLPPSTLPLYRVFPGLRNVHDATNPSFAIISDHSLPILPLMNDSDLDQSI